MKFLSIKEYFYKLNTIGFILLLLPLLVFIFLYYYSLLKAPIVNEEQAVIVMLGVAITIFLLELTIVHWLWAVRIKRLKKHIELAKRMDGYFSLTLLKMAVYCGGSLMMAVGFFLTGSSWFTSLFILIALAIVFQWPSPASFCRRFDLRGGERDMILHDRLVTKNKPS